RRTTRSSRVASPTGRRRSSRSRRPCRSPAPPAASAQAGSAWATRPRPTPGTSRPSTSSPGSSRGTSTRLPRATAARLTPPSGLTSIGWLGNGNGQDGKGFLEAQDTATGASLWKSDLMTAPVGAAPVTYMVNGKQYVSVAVGGQSHNDVSRPLGLTNPKRLRDDAIYTFVLP